MAQAPAFTSWGSANIEKGKPYVKSDLPDPTINKMRIASAPKIQRNGETRLSKDRGVWILIARTGLTYSLPNVPTLYRENDEIVIDANNTYTFLSDCNIEYGVV